MTEREQLQGHRLRSDPHFVAARAVMAAGDVGASRTLRLGWSFPTGTDPVEAAAELADVALWLLVTDPASVYALAGDDDDPPLLHVNLLATNGALAVLEATVDAAGFPAQRELHLLGSEGEVVHRTGHDDLLWAVDGAEVFHASAGRGVDPSRPSGYDESPRRKPAISRAIAASLARREPVVLTEEVAR